VTDNDGDIAALQAKYAGYLNGENSKIRIFYDSDKLYPTLEPQLLKANSRQTLNTILGKKYADDATLLKYMSGNKTDCALKMFETTETWKTPEYIANAIE
jgi:putative ATP-dependent endonuclease of OLD family